MAFNLQDFLSGIAAGAASRGVMKRKPLAYLYNGVQLPGLPKTDLPYAYISKLSTDGYSYSLRISAEKHEVTSTGHSSISIGGENYVLRDNGTEWESTTNTLLVTGIVEWANFDVLYNSAQGNLAGTLYLSASNPVPVGKPITDPLSFAMGWQLGQRLRMRELIGYSYNGVVLPALPEWDKSKYPYAFIFPSVLFGIVSAIDFRIYVSSKPIHYNGSYMESDETVSLGYATVKTSDALWGELSYTENESFKLSTIGSYITWANYDIQNSDGSVFLAASEPVPVYERGGE